MLQIGGDDALRDGERFQYELATWPTLPPSTNQTAPLTYAPARPARNKIGPAISANVPERPRGTACARSVGVKCARLVISLK